MLLCLFLLLKAIFAYSEADKCFNYGLPTNCTLPELSSPKIITPIIDGGVYPIEFGEGNLGMSANVSFTVYINQAQYVSVAVFDCFCMCDSFGILVNGLQNQATIRYGVAVDLDEPCVEYYDNPQECYFNTRSYIISVLPAGFNNVTITSALSPLGGGVAYAWFWTMVDSDIPFPVCFPDCNWNPIYPVDTCENLLNPLYGDDSSENLPH